MIKKYGILACILFTLVGCSAEENNNANPSNTNEEKVESFQEDTMTDEEYTEVDENSSSLAEAKENDGKIVFVPQKYDLENGYTVETDPLFLGINEKVEEAVALGIPNDVSLHYTGYYLGAPGNGDMKGVFIFVNRMDVAIKNIEVEMSYGTIDGEFILDSQLSVLSEDIFGISEPNTAMPIYLPIPPEKEQIILDTTDSATIISYMDNIKYEKVK